MKSSWQSAGHIYDSLLMDFLWGEKTAVVANSLGFLWPTGSGSKLSHEDEELTEVRASPIMSLRSIATKAQCLFDAAPLNFFGGEKEKTPKQEVS